MTPLHWTLVGLLGQAIFTGRFLLQWVVSERRRESVVPVAFWWMSLAGSVLLALYAGSEGDPVFLLGTVVSAFIYTRNLILIHSGPERGARKRVLVPLALLLTLAILWVAWPDADVPLGWLSLGFAGAILWSGRFVIQWFASERAGRSVMPRAFWYTGLLGSVFLLAYSVYRQNPVFILGYLFPPVPYIRNLILIYRKEGAPRILRLAAVHWRQRRALIVVLLVVVVGSFLAVRTRRSEDVAGDFLRYHRAGTMVLMGNADHLYDRDPLFDVYSDERYVEHPVRYLPAFAVIMAPVALLTPETAEVLWTWLNAFNFTFILMLSWRLCRCFGARVVWMWIPFLFLIRYGWDNLNLGQINPTVIMLAMTGIFLTERDRPRTGGALAGLAAAIKLTPLIILAVFLLRRQWRAFGAGLAVFLAGTFLLPAAVLGPARTLRLAGAVTERQGTALVVSAEQDEVPGESLKAMAYRILGPYPFHKHHRRIHVSLGWLTPGQAQWAYRISAAALVGWFFWFVFVKRRRLHTPLVWGAAFLVALLVSPETRQAHFLSLALPVTVLTMVLASGRLSRPRWGAVISLLALAFLLAALPGRAIVGKTVAYHMAALCVSGFAALFMLAAVGVAAVVGDEKPEDAAG